MELPGQRLHQTSNGTNGHRPSRIAFAVESMRYHTSSEGWEIFKGLAYHGYQLAGFNLTIHDTNASRILTHHDPDICVIQDPREWDVKTGDFREPRARFLNHNAFKCHRSIKGTILKDAHYNGEYHSRMSSEMGIDFHIIYYDEEVVRAKAPWLGSSPVIRTYHSLDKNLVPDYEDRTGVALLSGALSQRHYPLRTRLARELNQLPQGTAYVPHPGYHRKGCATPAYLRLLSNYRVAICTCSIHQYALRKLIEATACGCIVITNLPEKYKLPHIDDNLIRVDSDITAAQLSDVITALNREYDPAIQLQYAEVAKAQYDYKVITNKLAQDIEAFYKTKEHHHV